MTKFADKFRIETSRLKNWNYSSSGVYFITICTLNHNNFFGKIIDDQMIYTQCGEIAKNELLKTFEIRKNLKLIDWVLMPNHVHFLFSIRDFHVETRCDASLQLNSIEFPNIHSHRNHPDFYKEINIKSNQVIPSAIRAYKQSVKRICNQQNLFFAWQSGYFDEIINNKTRLMVIKNYIKNNPKNWQKDKLYSLK